MGYYSERIFGWAVTLFAFVLVFCLTFWDYDHNWPIARILWALISSIIDPIIDFVKGLWE